MTLPSNLLLTYTAYFVGAASPGPSSLALVFGYAGIKMLMSRGASAAQVL